MDDAFLGAYFSIDRTMKKRISKQQLIDYKDKMNYEDKFVEKWMKLFDRSHSGVITLDEFCDVLGLELKEIEEKRDEWLEKQQLSTDGGDSENAEMIGNSKMDKEMQHDIIEKSKSLRKEFPNDCKEVSKRLKAYVDEKYGRAWAILIVRGNYWANYSFVPEDNLVFKLGRDIFIVYRCISE